jgi:glycosyltransferase involved in cell wall biosynthesis
MRSDQSPVSSTSLDMAIPLAMPREEERADRPVPLGRRLRRKLSHVLARQFLLVPVVALAIARLVGRRRRPIPEDGCEILLTGRFDSENWIINHLGPLAASKKCSRVWMVSTNPVPPLLKVTPIYPPRWLSKVLGATPARLLSFAWAALWRRPHVVGGFHLIPNGIAAAIMGSLAGARSVYFSVGGKTEVIDGGLHSETQFLRRMETPDAIVEKRLLSIVSRADMVITMGTKAIRFFRDKGIDTHFNVVSGGIDSQRFRPAQEAPLHDLILTGRLVEIKRIDIFLQAIKRVAERIPEVKAVVVGDGKLRGSLQSLSVDLGIDRHVSFVGHQAAVENWLPRAKVFVLTSDSEGLSLSMMEAMMCGLPAVVSDVGDLGDLVENGVNGYLVPRRSPDLVAERLIELLSDTPKLAAFSEAARRSALRYETQATIQRWDSILAGF